MHAVARAFLLIGTCALFVPAVLPGAPLQPSTSRPKASEADSLAAERMAWAAIRSLSSATGTRAFRERLALRGRSAIVDALLITPGNEWLNSITLRYRPAGAPPAASPASRATCGASPWWCDLLHMLALYRTRSAAADSMLLSALTNMPAHVRCIWGDVAMLISEGSARRDYEHMSCDERREFEDRLWWLSDPLLSTPLNERRLEHYAREVNMRLDSERSYTSRSRSGTPGLAFSLKAMRRATHLMHGTDILQEPVEIAVPFDPATAPRGRFDGFLDRAADALGWSNPIWHGRPMDARYEPTLWGRMDTILRKISVGPAPRDFPAARLHFIPLVDAIHTPLLAHAEHWDLQLLRPREWAWSPVGHIVPLDHQHAFFRRGDSARLAFITDISTVPFLHGTLNRAALVHSRSPHSVPVVHRLSGGPRYVFSPLVPADSMLLSLEVVALGRGGGRTRFGAAPRPTPAGRLAVSDILLLQASSDADAPATDLESALPRALANTAVREKSALGLFWEIYGLAAGERPQITVSAIREPGGIFARAIGGLFGGSRSGELLVSYPDVAASGEGIEGRTLTLDLSALSSGRYVFEIRVELPGEAPAGATRRVELVRR